MPLVQIKGISGYLSLDQKQEIIRKVKQLNLHGQNQDLLRRVKCS